jgi:hypothetical protein
MSRIMRITLFKLPDPSAVQEAIEKYSALGQAALKVLLSLCFCVYPPPLSLSFSLFLSIPSCEAPSPVANKSTSTASIRPPARPPPLRRDRAHKVPARQAISSRPGPAQRCAVGYCVWRERADLCGLRWVVRRRGGELFGLSRAPIYLPGYLPVCGSLMLVPTAHIPTYTHTHTHIYIYIYTSRSVLIAVTNRTASRTSRWRRRMRRMRIRARRVTRLLRAPCLRQRPIWTTTITSARRMRASRRCLGPKWRRRRWSCIWMREKREGLCRRDRDGDCVCC